ncbi:hypothetical protein [Streptomyces sp. NPDC001787]|uniref:hypothetical protein n=1 Tax=Streptomyces sp. NPDC001787 TaxID=3154523 RepID=UPI00332C1147
MAVEARSDPISLAGITDQLRQCASVQLTGLTPDTDTPPPQIAVVLATTIDEELLVTLRRIKRTSEARSILIISDIDAQTLVSAVTVGVVSVILRSEATTGHLEQVITESAKDGAHLPAQLLNDLLAEVGRLQGEVLGPRGLHFTGLASREPAPAGRARPRTHDGTTAITPTPAPHAPTCPSPCRKPGGRT